MSVVQEKPPQTGPSMPATQQQAADEDLYHGYGHSDDADSKIPIDVEQLRQAAMATNRRSSFRPSSRAATSALGGGSDTRTSSVQSTARTTASRNTTSERRSRSRHTRGSESRPSTTAVRPADRSSAQTKQQQQQQQGKGTVTISKRPTFPGASPSMLTATDPERPARKYREMEKCINDHLEQSCLAYEDGDLGTALDKAKEATRKQRDYVKQKAADVAMNQPASIDDFGAPSEADTFYSVLFNLGTQYLNSSMLTEALKTYDAILKNKSFSNIGHLHVNIGNIHFLQGNHNRAIKHYQMCLDQISDDHAKMRSKILNNIAICFVKTNQFERALNTFQQIMQVEPTIRTGFSIFLCSKLLGQTNKLQDAFQQLLTIDIKIDSEEKHIARMQDDRNHAYILEAIRNDDLQRMEKNRKSKAESCIMMAARIIAGESDLRGKIYDWAIGHVKSSHFHELGNKMEVNKVIQCLKDRKLDEATETLTAVQNSMRGVTTSSSVATNLALMCHLLSADETEKHAEKYLETALAADRYNSAAIVNQGNILFQRGDFQNCRDLYKEAVRLNASCPEALYNLGLSEKRLGRYPEALKCFQKLLTIVKKDSQVIFQMADLHDLTGDRNKAVNWFVQLLGTVPSDVGILCRLAKIHESMNDKTQAFAYYMDAFRYDPNNTSVLSWLGIYFVETQSVDRAIKFFHKGTLVQPNNIHWQLMVASCHRRSGNYHQAIVIYKDIHRRFPDNLECLQLLVRLCTDTNSADAPKLRDKLKRVEKLMQTRQQRLTKTSDKQPAGLPQENNAAADRQRLPTVSEEDSDGAEYRNLPRLDPGNSHQLKTSCRQELRNDFTNIGIDDLLPH